MNQKEKRRDQYLRRNYGLGLVDYNRILKAQNGSCFICQRKARVFKRSLAVDHCHRTLKIRGLLCPWCNKGLRYYSDNPAAMRRAAEHLERDTGFSAPKNRPRHRRKKRK